MNKPKVSVIIPTYNRRKYLKRAIDSVKSQTYSNFELIVVDDGSTDGTSQLIRHKYPRIRYLHQSQKGVSAARNLGVKEANGDWLAFLDSDDEWLANKLELQISLLESNSSYQICHSNEIWLRNGELLRQKPKHKKHGGLIFDKCLAMCLISPSSVVINKEIFEKVGLFDEDLPACEDYDLWLRITALYEVLHLEEDLIIKHGGHEDQLSMKYAAMDRFRIKSLCKLIDSSLLSNIQLRLACEMLCKKINIYLIGARKRNKENDIILYESLLDKYIFHLGDVNSY